MDYEESLWTDRFEEKWGKCPFDIAAQFKKRIPDDGVMTRMLRSSLDSEPGPFALMSILNGFDAYDLQYTRWINSGQASIETPIQLARAIAN